MVPGRPRVETTELRVWGHEGNKTSQEREPEARKPEREQPRGLPLVDLRSHLRIDPRVPGKELSKVRTRSLENWKPCLVVTPTPQVLVPTPHTGNPSGSRAPVRVIRRILSQQLEQISSNVNAGLVHPNKT